jgi:hypothetical protein
LHIQAFEKTPAIIFCPCPLSLSLFSDPAKICPPSSGDQPQQFPGTDSTSNEVAFFREERMEMTSLESHGFEG